MVEPETPRVGPNRVTVWIRDRADRPVTGACLKAVAVMPAMGAMPTMYAPAQMRETGPGRYEGEFRPSMAGEWPLTVEIAGPAGKARLTFDLATGRKGIRCSSCGTAVSPVGTIRVDPARRQLIGIRSAPVKRRPLVVTLRLPGAVKPDPGRVVAIAPRFGGWIETLVADTAGQPVRRGQPLMTIYSPELISAQEELLAARGSATLVAGVHSRLRRWGLPADWVRSLLRRGRIQETVRLQAPIDGVVLGEPLPAGSGFRAGQTLLQLADLSRLWVEAAIYPPWLDQVRAGMAAEVVLPGPPQRRWKTRVDYVYPWVEETSRSGRMRLVLENPWGLLPGHYVTVRLRLDLGDGRLQPRRIEAGRRNRDWIEVRSGLAEGEMVVVSGVFLIAAESKLKAGVAAW
ncbi:efflux RND transporter periplasmic adaptor subunit [Methylomarinovum caldicuralii]|uniref:efflux RND transporter periplasmic adaptor subunit n=1 Tax=Methylomarinovum caldicuralii TaxID=438856 RepID=UPI002953B69B|nr:efflux RND transporter periplasmic adaptor subunit [Methylomarinovum caldicuralii]